MKKKYLCFACIQIFISTFLLNNNVLSSVDIDYPNTGVFYLPDENLPGIPSKQLSEYIEEIMKWGDEFGIELNKKTVEHYLNNELSTGFTSDVISFQNKKIFRKNTKAIDIMRHIIFLQTVQKSIEDWNTNYYNKEMKTFYQIYDRAKSIYQAFQSYLEEKDIDNQYTNPLTVAIFGAGNNSYGNFFEDDGSLEQIYESQIISVISEGVTAYFSKNDDFIKNIYSNAKTWTNVSEISAGFVINIIKQSDPQLGKIVNDLKTAAFALWSRGIGLILAPGQMFYDTCKYLHDDLKNQTLGRQFIVYYHYKKYMPSRVQYLLNSEGIIDFGAGQINKITDVNNEPGDKLTKFAKQLETTSMNFTTPETEQDKKTAKNSFHIANLLICIESLNVKAMKKNLVSNINLNYLHDYGNLYKRKIYSVYDDYKSKYNADKHRLGRPISDNIPFANSYRQIFEHGFITPTKDHETFYSSYKLKLNEYTSNFPKENQSYEKTVQTFKAKVPTIFTNVSYQWFIDDEECSSRLCSTRPNCTRKYSPGKHTVQLKLSTPEGMNWSSGKIAFIIQESIYSDVRKERFSYDHIDNVTSNNIMSGNLTRNSTINFMPDSYVTRAEALKIVYKAAGRSDLPECENDQSSGFSDVFMNDWYCKYTQDALKNNYIAHNSTFRPNEEATRAETVKLISKLFNVSCRDNDNNLLYDNEGKLMCKYNDTLLELAHDTEFSDITNTNWCYPYVYWMTNAVMSNPEVNPITESWGARVMEGYIDQETNERTGEFGDQDYLSRELMAIIIVNTKSYLDGVNQTNNANITSIGYLYEQKFDKENPLPPDDLFLEVGDHVTIPDNKTHTFSFEDYDTNGDKLFYFWNVTDGSFTSNKSNYSTVTWYPPSVETYKTFIINCVRGDNRGYVGRGTFKINVINAENYMKKITGNVFDELNSPITDALIILLENDSDEIIDFSYSSMNGNFFFSVPATNKKYYILVEKEGYHSYDGFENTINLENNSVVNLGNLKLNSDLNINLPQDIINFQIAYDNNKVFLDWDIPTENSKYQNTLIVRSASPIYWTPDFGEYYGEIFSGLDVIYDFHGTSNVDLIPSKGKIYYYKAFAYDSDYNYSDGISASISIPSEIEATETSVGNLQGTTTYYSMNLSWTAPLNTEYDSYLVVKGNWKPSDNISYNSGENGIIYNSTGKNCSENGLKIETDYNYTVYAYKKYSVYDEIDKEYDTYTIYGDGRSISIRTKLGGTLEENLTLEQKNSPHILQTTLTVPKGITLTIEPGCIIKISNYNTNININGYIKAKASQNDPIIFTSINNSSIGGRTGNVDRKSGDWGYIQFLNGSSGIMKYVTIEYAGGNADTAYQTVINRAGLYIYSDPELDHVLIRNINNTANDYAVGIWLIENASPIIENSVITQVESYGIYSQSTKIITIQNSAILDNGGGIYSSGVDIDAQYVSWGDDSGPFHSTLNPEGKGNKVSDHVIFDPWLKEDSDNDGMSNSYEWSYDLDPFNPNDAYYDSEDDGLTNYQESQYGTNPFLKDTDKDKMPDKWEIEHNLNPLVKNGYEDLDNDGLTNIEEYIIGTNPNNSSSRINTGDLNGDNLINIEDVIIALKIIVDIEPVKTVYPTTFIGNRIELPDAIYIIKSIANE